LVDFDPVRGSEVNKRRPAVLVSNDRANLAAQRLGRGVVTVVPISSNVGHVFAFQTQIAAGTAGLRVDSKAQAEQVRSVSIDRLGSALGRLPSSTLAELDAALCLHLSL
jgi:mRNA interferase MazF